VRVVILLACGKHLHDCIIICKNIKTFVISLSRNRSKFFELAWGAKLIGETRPIEVLAKNVLKSTDEKQFSFPKT
jgi:hypothetical protein